MLILYLGLHDKMPQAYVRLSTYRKEKSLLNVATSASTSAGHTLHGNGATPQSTQSEGHSVRADTVLEGIIMIQAL